MAEFLSTLVSTLLGVFAGGWITLRINQLERKAEAADQNSATQAHRIANMRVVAAKLQTAHRAIASQVIEFEKGSAAAKLGQEPWQYQRAVAAMPSGVTLTDEQTVELMELDDSLFNELTLFMERYDLALKHSAIYREQRAELLAQMKPDRSNGTTGSVPVEPEVYVATAPARAHLNEFVTTMHRYNLEDAASGMAIMRRLIEAINTNLGTTMRIEDTNAGNHQPPV